MSRRNTLLVAARLLLPILLTSVTGLFATEPIAAFKQGVRVLFQGDSITDGNRGRNADPNHILGHGYVFIIAARHGAQFPQAKVEFINRCISGNTVSQLQQRWQKDSLELKPDLVSILVGVNDHGRGVPLEDLGRSSSLDKITHCSFDDFLFFGSG